MKKTDLEKNKGLKLMGKLKSAKQPDRFASTGQNQERRKPGTLMHALLNKALKD